MSKQLKLTIISVALSGIAILLQSTVLGYIAIDGVKPDLSLIILVFIAIRTGRMVGQITGFFSGFIQDFLSFPPLGFYAIIRTLIGSLYGLIRGALFTNSILIPIFFVLIATILKGILVGIIASAFSVTNAGFSYFHSKIWIEIAYNALLAPLLFALLNMIKIYRLSVREEA